METGMASPAVMVMVMADTAGLAGWVTYLHDGPE